MQRKIDNLATVKGLLKKAAGCSCLDIYIKRDRSPKSLGWMIPKSYLLDSLPCRVNKGPWFVTVMTG